MKYLIGPFPGDVKPVRDGVYRRFYSNEYSDEYLWCNFKNGDWYCGCASLEFATYKVFLTSGSQNLPWFGLTEEGYNEYLKSSASK